MTEAAEYAIGAQVYRSERRVRGARAGGCRPRQARYHPPCRKATARPSPPAGPDQARRGGDATRTAAALRRGRVRGRDYAKGTEFVPAPDGRFVYPANERLLMPDFGPEDTDGVGGGRPGDSPLA